MWTDVDGLGRREGGLADIQKESLEENCLAGFLLTCSTQNLLSSIKEPSRISFVMHMVVQLMLKILCFLWVHILKQWLPTTNKMIDDLLKEISRSGFEKALWSWASASSSYLEQTTTDYTTTSLLATQSQFWNRLASRLGGYYKIVMRRSYVTLTTLVEEETPAKM